MKEGYAPVGKKITMKGMAWLLGHPSLYRLASNETRFSMRFFPFLINNKTWNPWYKQRNLPTLPKESFRDWTQNKNSNDGCKRKNISGDSSSNECFRSIF